MRMAPILMLLYPLTLWAQITTTDRPEEGRYSHSSVYDRSFRRVELPHNSPKAIRDELFDDATVRNIGKAVGVSDGCLSAVRLHLDVEEEKDSRDPYFSLYWLPVHDDEAHTLLNALDAYVTARSDGHTQAFMQAAITNSTPLAEVKDAGIRAILKEYPLTPVPLLRKIRSVDFNHTATIGGKQVFIKSLATYGLVDGEIGWRWVVDFDEQGDVVGFVSCSRYDAKEDDEKYAEVFKQVSAEVKAQMKKDGSAGTLGSIHTYLRLKKEKLAKRGILWRSPSELNPDSRFD
ncbi:MAG: hypothetical protein FWG50_13180 [Kiritimatiellaeota bacterium]|nr:hypothetical protein [Kiritimatiellota bacterium]